MHGTMSERSAGEAHENVSFIGSAVNMCSTAEVESEICASKLVTTVDCWRKEV